MCLIIVVGVIGLLCSVFFGSYGAGIFFWEGRKPDYKDKGEPGWTWKAFQFWLNFICSAVGWTIAIYFLLRLQRDPSQFAFKVDDAIPLLIALLGITGLLPRLLFLGKVPFKG
jgi:hypothetical protein